MDERQEKVEVPAQPAEGTGSADETSEGVVPATDGGDAAAVTQPPGGERPEETADAHAETDHSQSEDLTAAEPEAEEGAQTPAEEPSDGEAQARADSQPEANDDSQPAELPQGEDATAGETVADAGQPDQPEDGAGEENPPVEAADTEMTAEDLMGDTSTEQASEASTAEANLRAVIEAVIYVTEEPLTIDQISTALELPKERVQEILKQIEEECARPERGVSVREVAGGYKMGTKPEHHEAIRAFVKKLRPPFKLSLAALETLAVIAYKQPITAPEIMEVRGVQGAGVVKTLLDRKLITPAGRKQVVGKPILYKTTKEFLLQFGLKDLAELPTLKEFEELRRLVSDDDVTPVEAPAPPPPQGPQQQELLEPEEATKAEPPAEPE